MDSLKSLMDKKQYDLVLKLTNNSTDPTHLFYRISAFLALGKGEESLNTIINNRKILESDLSILIKVHIEILCLLNRFDEAYVELKYYENLPYVSQQVEEILREMPNYIRQEERKSFSSKEMDDEHVKKLIRSKEMNDVIIALDVIRERGIEHFLEDLKYLMINHEHQSIRSFSLLVLVQKKLNQLVDFKHIDKIIQVNPSLVNPPFVGDKFNGLVRKLSIDFNNPSLSENATQILSTYLMFIYPDELSRDDEVIIEALYQISSKYLQSKSEDLLTRCEKKNLDVEEVQHLIDDINFALENF